MPLRKYCHLKENILNERLTYEELTPGKGRVIAEVAGGHDKDTL